MRRPRDRTRPQRRDGLDERDRAFLERCLLEPLDGPTLARLASQARSDPEFFGLDKDGTPLEPDEL